MSDPDRTIWCGNLSRELQDEIIYELFLQAGPLERMHRPKDQKSGEPREFAFITFEDEDSVPYALELFKDTRLYGRPIRMQAKGVVKEPRRGAHIRSVTAPPAPLLAPAPWRPPPPPPPSRNDVMLRQMAAQQMLMLAQQAALGQQQFRPGPWQRQAPPGFMPPQGFGPYGGPPPRGRHHQRSNTHHW